MRFSCVGGARLALPIHNSNLGDCFRLGRNYTLAVTETVRRLKTAPPHSLRISGGRHSCQEERFEPVVPGARVRLATDPGAARTMNRSEMLGRRHSEKNRSWRPGTSRSLAHSTPETPFWEIARATRSVSFMEAFGRQSEFPAFGAVAVPCLFSRLLGPSAFRRGATGAVVR